MARPTSLTPAASAAIVKNLKLGMPVEYAAEAAGIVRATLYNWKARGKLEPRSIYGKFLGAVKKAEAELMAECLRAVKVGVKSWQSRAWILERKWPGIWSTDRELLQELKRFLREQKKERERREDGAASTAPGEDTTEDRSK